MELGYGIAAKLDELEREYGRLQDSMQTLSGKSAEQIARERRRIEDEFRVRNILLEQTAKSCRSPAVALLSDFQRDYGQRLEKILDSDLPGEIRGRTGEEDRTEALALYAEYAIDFAAQAMRHALISALNAMELQATQGEHARQGG